MENTNEYVVSHLHRSNCLFWSLLHICRNGGRIRVTRHPIIPGKIRSLWSPDLSGSIWWTYLPNHPKRKWYHAYFHAMCFEGRPVRYQEPKNRGYVEIGLVRKK